MKEEQPNLPSWIAENVPMELVRSSLFKFSVTLRDASKIEVDLLPDLDIDYEQLEKQLSECPAQYIYWAAVYSEVKQVSSYIERRIKFRRSQLTRAATEVTGENRLRLTADQVKAVIEGDEQLVKLEEQLLNTQKREGKLYHMIQAIRMKSEHLRSLAGFKRQELDGR